MSRRLSASRAEAKLKYALRFQDGFRFLSSAG
jgi:hypothetical protein